MGRRCRWQTRTRAMLCDGTDYYATAGSRLTRQSGLGEQCKATQRGMRWVCLVLTSRSLFFRRVRTTFAVLGTSSFESAGIFFLVTILL